MKKTRYVYKQMDNEWCSVFELTDSGPITVGRLRIEAARRLVGSEDTKIVTPFRVPDRSVAALLADVPQQRALVVMADDSPVAAFIRNNDYWDFVIKQGIKLPFSAGQSFGRGDANHPMFSLPRTAWIPVRALTRTRSHEVLGKVVNMVQNMGTNIRFDIADPTDMYADWERTKTAYERRNP